VVLATSADGGRTWSGPRAVVDPPGFIRAFDATLWLDPQGRLWLFWAQAAGHWDGRGGVWAAVADDAGREHPGWSEPRRISDGVMLNKPVVSPSGSWLLPVAFWMTPPTLPLINERDKLNLSAGELQALLHDLGSRKGLAALASDDNGRTFQLRGMARFPAGEVASEHMIVPRGASLWMLARAKAGIVSSISHDGGRTWSDPAPSGIPHPFTRFNIGRLRSGNLLLVRHNPPNGRSRSHLTAFLSTDDGRTWPHSLLLDRRGNVSYPDAVEMPDGTIHVIYDRDRFTEREILLASFREEDIRKGGGVRRSVVNRAGVLSPDASLPEAPDLPGGGWTPLLNGKDLTGWKPRPGNPHRWFAAADAYLDEAANPALLQAEAAGGSVIVNGPNGRTSDLLSAAKFGDHEIYLEYLIPQKSNSGVYVHGLYEVQIFDSFGVRQPGVHDNAAIYERWINGRGSGGAAPLRNASRRPGEWQSFHIWFRAPRFDRQRRKTENARFLRVLHNGVVVHRNIEPSGPTRAAMEFPEAPQNPLMIQGDHGPVALRNIYVRPLPAKPDER
jgi:hypothetical protein